MESMSAASAVSLPVFSPGKSIAHSTRWLLQFSSTFPKNYGNNESNHKSDSSDSALVPIFRNPTLSKDATMGFVLRVGKCQLYTTEIYFGDSRKIKTFGSPG